MTKEEAVAKARQAIKEQFKVDLPVVGTDYACLESVRERAEAQIGQARQAGNSDDAWESAVRADAEAYWSRLASAGPYWVIRFDRCPPSDEAISPPVYIVRVYDQTDRVVIVEGM